MPEESEKQEKNEFDAEALTEEDIKSLEKEMEEDEEEIEEDEEELEEEEDEPSWSELREELRGWRSESQEFNKKFLEVFREKLDKSPESKENTPVEMVKIVQKSAEEAEKEVLKEEKKEERKEETKDEKSSPSAAVAESADRRKRRYRMI